MPIWYQNNHQISSNPAGLEFLKKIFENYFELPNGKQVMNFSTI